MDRRRIAQDVLYARCGLFLLGLLVQFFLAGAGAVGAASFDAHAGLGVLLVLAALLVLVVALVAGSFRVPAALLLGVMVLQSVLGGLRRDREAWIGAFHAVNAVLVLAVAYYLFRTTREGRSLP